MPFQFTGINDKESDIIPQEDMSLTFEQKLANVPPQVTYLETPHAKLIFDISHLDDHTLKGMLCIGDQKINTTGIETAYALQTPLKNYIVFAYKDSTKNWNALYHVQNFEPPFNRSQFLISAPNSSFLLQRGAIPVADLGRIRLSHQSGLLNIPNKLYFSSTAQLAIEFIVQNLGMSYTDFLSKNVSNISCSLLETIAPFNTFPATTPINSLQEKESVSSNTILYVIISLLAALILLGTVIYSYFFYFMRRSKHKDNSITIHEYRQINHVFY